MTYIPVTIGEQDSIQVITAFGGGETPALALRAVDVVGGITSTRELTNTGDSEFVGIATFRDSLLVEKDFSVAGVSTFVGDVTFGGGTIGLGDAPTDSVVFAADVDSSILPNTDNTFDLGSIVKRWRDIYLNVGVGKTYGIAYFGANAQLVSTTTPSALGITTSSLILTVDDTGGPGWSDGIDGGFF